MAKIVSIKTFILSQNILTTFKGGNMEASAKKRLLNMTYFGVIAIMVAMAIFFFVTLGGASMAAWEKVSLYILLGLIVLATIYDVICTMKRKDKFVVGIIIYVLTLALVVLSLIIFAINSANGRLLIDITEKFFRILLFANIINILGIVVFCVGEKLIVNESNRAKK